MPDDFYETKRGARVLTNIGEYQDTRHLNSLITRQFAALR